MSLLTDETIERVREAADIVEIVSAYTELRRTGTTYMGVCPFHEERSPSFSVDSVKKVYNCFGCDAGGDVFKFVMEQEGLGFPETVEMLGDRYGIELEREKEDPELEEKRRRRNRLAEVLGRTSEYYSTYLRDSPKAAKPRDYLAGRRLSEQTLADFGVGYAPSDWGTVLELGQRAGFSVAELGAAGLIKRSQKGSYYDHFRSRITFPIRDARGKVIGFGARRLEGDDHPAKYMNSPEGELYHKSKTLYGIDRARGPIGKSGRAVVVEGYMDVLALHQCGVQEAVAVMGTAITPEQLRELSMHAEEVVLAMDADRAGRDAMLKAQRTLARTGGGREVRLRVVAMPQGQDPADMLLAESGGGAEAVERFRKLIEEAVEMPVFHVRAILADANLGTPAGRDDALDEVVPVIAAMGQTISRDELTREVADKLDAPPELVMRRIAQGATPKAPTTTSAVERGGDPGPEDAGRRRPAREKITPRRLSAQEQYERALLAMCVAAPDDGAEYLSRLTAEHLSPGMERARLWLVDHLDAPLSGLPRDDDELFTLVTQLVMRADHEPVSEESMALNFNLLELRLVERQIDAAKDAGEVPVDMQKKRADLAELIAHGQAHVS